MRPFMALCGWLFICFQTCLAQPTKSPPSSKSGPAEVATQDWLAPMMDAAFLDADGQVIASQLVRSPFQSKRKDGDKIWTGEAWVDSAKVLPVTEALKHYTELLESPEKQTAEAYCRRAAVYRHRGELTFALFDFNRALQLQADFALALAARGAIYRLAGSLEQATKDLEAANRLKANDPETLIELGHLALERSNIEKALSTYESAAKLSPSSTAPLRAIAAAHIKQGKIDEAIKHYDAAYAVEPSAEILLDRADAHYQAGHFDEARTDVDKLVKLDSKNVNAWTLHGMVHVQLGNDQYALASFDKAVQLDNKNPIVNHNRGVFHLQHKRYPLAASDLQDALEQDKNFVPSMLAAAWLFVAVQHPRVHQPDVAIALALRALDLTQHKNMTAYTILAAAYAAQGSFDDALRCQREAIELAKNNKASSEEVDQMEKQLAQLADKKTFTPKLIPNYER